MSSESNPYVGVNYIPDNPRMAVPPPYWLQRLHNFDPDLVVLPSRQQPYAYVLARRARLSGQLLPMAVISTNNDTAMCARHGLVPISMIHRQHNTDLWSIDNILADLESRDTWRVRDETHTAKDGTKVTGAAAVMERHEEAKEATLKASIRDSMDHRSRDAWRSYQARTGQRSRIAPGHTPGSTVAAGYKVIDRRRAR